MRNTLSSGLKIAAFVAGLALAASGSFGTLAAPNTGSGQTSDCKDTIATCKAACIKRYRGSPSLITDCRNNCEKKCTTSQSTRIR